MSEKQTGENESHITERKREREREREREQKGVCVCEMYEYLHEQ